MALASMLVLFELDTSEEMGEKMLMDDETKKLISELQQSNIAAHAELVRITVRQYATEMVLTDYLGRISRDNRDDIMAEIEETAKNLHQTILLRFENVNPGLAAQLDRRNSSEFPEMDEVDPPTSE